MIMRDNGKVMTECEDVSDGMPEWVDASDDDGVVYPVTGESLVARRALNTHIKVDDAEQQRENIFHTRCHVNNKVCIRECVRFSTNIFFFLCSTLRCLIGVTHHQRGRQITHPLCYKPCNNSLSG